jgi:hypothetical protein
VISLLKQINDFVKRRMLRATLRVVGVAYFAISSPMGTSCPEGTSSNVTSRVDIAVNDETADGTSMYPFGETLAHHGAAAGAFLRCASGIHRHVLAASILGFAREDAEEESPCYFADRLAEQLGVARQANSLLVPCVPLRLEGDVVEIATREPDPVQVASLRGRRAQIEPVCPEGHDLQSHPACSHAQTEA